jgi:Asp-tRNA(Asn)/Glu-tRNA(Gln) amidotransferase A subunit family amidase
MTSTASADPFKLEEANIADLHRAMGNGQITARALVQAYLRHIDAYDKNGPAINAIIQINPKALEEADRLGSAFKKTGLTGPVHGVPILVKDATQPLICHLRAAL